MLNIYLTSGSNIKVQAVKNVLSKLRIEGALYPLHEFSKESNQTQPLGFEQTIKTAKLRLDKAKTLINSEWDYIIVLENGLIDIGSESYDICYCLVCDKNGNIEQSFSNATLITKDIAKQVKEGHELGPLVQELFNVEDKDPVIAFTNGKVKREDILTFAVENTLSRMPFQKQPNMTIALCGSTAFYDQMDKIQIDLEKLGYKVLHPKQTGPAYSVDLKDLYKSGKHKSDMSKESREIKRKLITSHMIAIQNSDAILVVNLEKNGKQNYIGGNVFLEMGFAFGFGKKVFVLNDLPTYSPYIDEISGLIPIIIHNNLNLIQ